MLRGMMLFYLRLAGAIAVPLMTQRAMISLVARKSVPDHCICL